MLATPKDQSTLNGLEVGQEQAPVLQVLGNWTAGKGPLYRRLAQALRSAIERGDLPPGLRLPPERVLARSLSVSRSTVVAAYDLLERDAVLDRRQGSGTRILEGRNQLSAQRPALTRALSRNTLFRRITAGPDGTIDFLGAYLVGSSGLPASVLAGIDQELARLSDGSGYAPLGYPPLRQAIAQHLTQSGLPTAPEQVLVTSGAQQAIHLAGWHFLQPGDTALVENPTYPGALDAFGAAGGRLAWVPTGRQGANVERLSELVQRTSPRLLYLIPTFQNPTGGVMPEHHRRAVARLVEARAIPLVEDESLAVLALQEGRVPPPIAAFAPGAPILTIGSLSKLFWGGLRVGWIRAPAPLVAQLGRLKAVADLGGSLPGQVIATRLLERFEVVRRERCAELSRRFALMSQLLQQHLPSWSWERPLGGLCLWVRLPRGTAPEFAQVALRHGVSLVAGPVASADNSFADFLRLPFGLEPATMEEGVQRLARAWQAYVPLAQPEHQALAVIV
jgi:DNA-binding transcriptional MocR family regulator